MSATRKAHPFESLSFVLDRAPNSRSDKQRCFWHVEPTGDYGEECKIGQRLAIEYLRYRQRADPGGHGVLGLIVRDMPPEHTGIEVGFLHIIDHAALARSIAPEQLVAYYDRKGAGL